MDLNQTHFQGLALNEDKSLQWMQQNSNAHWCSLLLSARSNYGRLEKQRRGVSISTRSFSSQDLVTEGSTLWSNYLQSWTPCELSHQSHSVNIKAIREGNGRGAGSLWNGKYQGNALAPDDTSFSFSYNSRWLLLIISCVLRQFHATSGSQQIPPCRVDMSLNRNIFAQ